MLELGPDLPEDDEEIERWCGEPLRAVVLPTAIFMTNKKGYPTLSRRHQVVLAKLLTMNPRLIAAQRVHQNVHALAWPLLGPCLAVLQARSLHLLGARLAALGSFALPQREAKPLGAKPLPWILEPAASKSPIPSALLGAAGEWPAGHAR